MPQGLRSSDHLLAPDQFVCSPELVHFRAPYNNAPQGSPHFGSFPAFGARRSLGAVLDAKKVVDDKAIGEFVSYMKILTHCSSRLYELHGALYDAQNVYLFKAFAGEVTAITKGPWTLGGSWELVRDHFMRVEGETSIALAQATHALDMNVPVDFVPQSKAILGEGACGRVYKAITADNVEVAIKIVVGAHNCSMLKREYQLISSLPAACAAAIVGVRENSYVEISVPRVNLPALEVAAFLMPFAGNSFEFFAGNHA